MIHRKVQYLHYHGNVLFEYVESQSDTEHNIKDCHHCGHCQGTHTQWVASNKSTLQTPKLIITNQYFYADHVDKIFTEEPIRPPIV